MRPAPIESAHELRHSFLVAQSERGVCAILLGEGAAELARDLARRFPHARLRHAKGELDTLVAKVASFLAAPAAGLDAPLDASIG